MSALSIVAGVIGICDHLAGGYLAGGSLIAGFGASLADVPGNLLQGAVGVLLGILVAAAAVAQGISTGTDEING